MPATPQQAIRIETRRSGAMRAILGPRNAPSSRGTQTDACDVRPMRAPIARIRTHNPLACNTFRVQRGGSDMPAMRGNGRTDGLTETHLTLWDEGSTTSRARAQTDFAFEFGIASLAGARRG